MNRISKRTGFTLVELIVAMAITGVIAYMVFSFSKGLLDAWKRSASLVERELDANFALDTIAADLESAMLLEDEGIMFAVTAFASPGGSDEWEENYNVSKNWSNTKQAGRPYEDDFLPEFPMISEAETEEEYEAAHMYGWSGMWLRFFTASPAMNAVSYQLIRRGTYSGSLKESYVLHRSVVKLGDNDSDLDVMGSGYALWSDTPLSLDYNVGEDVASAVGKSNSVVEPPLDDYLLENVVDFGVRLYRYEGDDEDYIAYEPIGLDLIYPSGFSRELPEPEQRSYFASQWEGEVDSELYPEVVEILLRVLDREGARILSQWEEGGSPIEPEAYRQLVAEHAKLYRRMVAIVARPR